MKRTPNGLLSTQIGRLPKRLRETVMRSWQRIRSPGFAAGGDWSEPRRDTLAKMLACSEYAATIIARDPDWFDAAVAAGRFESPAMIERPRLVDAAGSALPEADAKRVLRQARQQTMLHILWREYAGSATLQESLVSLSALADSMLLAAQRWAEETLHERFGTVVDADGRPVELITLAMGKLGGRELNFSSDIDVVFLYSSDGDSDGPRQLAAQDYFTRCVRRIVMLLDEVTEDGFVFRVDTRLRPFGDSGPLVVSIASFESYLLQHGRDWERYAYVKARVVGAAEIPQLADELLRQVIQPFVFRRYLDYGVFEALREMKSLIEAEVRKRELSDNVKLGRGGIREIEFIVQSLQLVRGGRNRKLRCSPLRTALRELVRCEELSADAAAELLDAYDFLRRLENFIQALRDHQTHDIPRDEQDLERVALAMQMGVSDLLSALQIHRDYVADHFRHIAFRSSAEQPQGSSEDGLIAAWNAGVDEDEWRSKLDQLQMPGSGRLARALVSLRSRTQIAQLDKTASKRLAEFVALLLTRLKSRESPLTIFERVLLIIEKILRRSAYLAMLNENVGLTDRLIDLCEQSAYFAEEISRYPVLLDELLDPRIFTSALSAGEMHADIADRMRQVDAMDSEGRVSVLGQYQRATMFRIAIADYSGSLPVMKVSDALTALAEQILVQALAIAWSDLSARHGEPWFELDGERQRAGFAVVAYGKLGGMELSYGSDLDLVFLHDSRGDEQQTDGTSPLENSMFFARLVRRLVHFLTTQTATGALYEVDTRLRPSGRSGLLVSTVESFERYQEENAWTWEHQALLRSRPVAGSVAVCREFSRVRKDTLCDRVDRSNLRQQVLTMRSRMRKELDRSSTDAFDLKHGAGGIGDIEFLVQYLALGSAHAHPEVIFYPDNIRQLGVLGAIGCLPAMEAPELQAIYRDYRVRAHRLALDSRLPLVPPGEIGAQADRVAGIWRREFAADGSDP